MEQTQQSEPTRLYVGNLSFGVTDRELRDAFITAGVGVDSAEVVRDRATQQSKGFGFVTLISGVDAAVAIKALDGAELRGRPIRVQPANPRPDTSRNRRDDRRHAGAGFSR